MGEEGFSSNSLWKGNFYQGDVHRLEKLWEHGVRIMKEKEESLLAEARAFWRDK